MARRASKSTDETIGDRATAGTARSGTGARRCRKRWAARDRWPSPENRGRAARSPPDLAHGGARSGPAGRPSRSPKQVAQAMESREGGRVCAAADVVHRVAALGHDTLLQGRSRAPVTRPRTAQAGATQARLDSRLVERCRDRTVIRIARLRRWKRDAAVATRCAKSSPGDIDAAGGQFEGVAPAGRSHARAVALLRCARAARGRSGRSRAVVHRRQKRERVRCAVRNPKGADGSPIPIEGRGYGWPEPTSPDAAGSRFDERRPNRRASFGHRRRFHVKHGSCGATASRPVAGGIVVQTDQPFDGFSGHGLSRMIAPPAAAGAHGEPRYKLQ